MFASKKGRAHITGDNPQFMVRYVGKIQTFTPGGQGCTQEPVQRIWDASHEEREMKRLLVTISPLGISLKDTAEKKATEQIIDIKDISYCCAQKGIHERIFAWISKDAKTKKIECHAVLCSLGNEAKGMSLALSQAFRIAYKSWKHEKDKLLRAKETQKMHLQEKTRLNNGNVVTDGQRSELSRTDSETSSELDLDNDLEYPSVFTNAMAQMNIVEENVLSTTENSIVVNRPPKSTGESKP